MNFTNFDVIRTSQYTSETEKYCFTMFVLTIIK